jgi:hypothetical protein
MISESVSVERKTTIRLDVPDKLSWTNFASPEDQNNNPCHINQMLSL